MPDGQRQRGGANVNRRSVLTGIAGGVLGTAALGSKRASAAYDDVVNVVDAGADPNGEEPIGDVLEAYAGDDVLLEFPPGEYLMTEQFRFTNYDNFGIVGDDATIVPGSIEEMDGRLATEGSFSGPTRLFRLGTVDEPGDDLHFEGLTFDFTAENSGFRAIEAYCERDMLVRDVDVVGEHDVGSFGPALFSLTDPDGNGTVEGFRAPDGGAYSENAIGGIEDGPTGMLVPHSHEGKLWVRDCELGGFPDNGLYTSCTDGRVVVDGGVYRNSNVASIRLAGDYSYVKGATVVVDENRPQDGNQRGIRLDEGKNLWVYDTDIRLEKPTGHGITVMPDVEKARIQDTSVTVGDRIMHGIVVQPGAGDVDVFTTDVEIQTGGHALLIQDDGGTVDCWHLTVTGDASGDDGGRHAIRCERDGCLFRHVRVWQPGDGYRRGLQLSGDDAYVYSGGYITRHIPIVVDGDDITIENVTARSFDGYEALKLLDHTADIDLLENALYYGIDDDGSDDPYFSDNAYPEG